jgi:hypothetical protein
MRDLAATAQGETATPIETCFDRLAAIEAYPEWYPAGVKEAQALERGPDGELTKVKATLALAQGPIQRDFTLHFAVALERPHRIELRRLPKSADDQELIVITWRLTQRGAQATALEIALEAKLDVPRFLPVGGIAGGIANGFMDAALASFNSAA